MRKNHSIADKLFRIVCLSFSVFLLFLSLLCNIGIMWTEARIDELFRDMEHVQRENDILCARIENRVSLAELEQIATHELGMHRPTAEQIIFLPLN